MTSTQGQQIKPELPILSTPNAAENPRQVVDVFAYLESANEWLRKEEHAEYNPKEDFEWFTSAQIDTTNFEGQYVAIWKKRIAGNGATPLEAERVAKFHYGEQSRPTIVFVSPDDVSEDEKKQVEKSRQDIAAGKAKRYENVEEYLKSLDEESD